MRKRHAVTTAEILEKVKDHVAPLPSQEGYMKSLAGLLAMHMNRNTLIDDGYAPDDLPVPSCLVLAPTGQGKTFLLRKMVKTLNLNLITVDCSTLVGENYKGVSLSQRIAGAMEEAKKSSKRKIPSNSFNGIQTWLQIILNREGRVLHRDPRLILFANGCYDFLTGERIPDYKLRDKFLPVRIKASFIPDEELETPVWDKFLENCSGGVAEVKMLMQEFVGYLLSPAEPDQIMLLSPCAGSGKSVLGNFVRELLGMEKTCAIALSNFGKSFEVSQIYGKVANFCLDISGSVLNDAVVAMLKRLTGGGDPETINIKYKDPFTYVNYAKLVFSCNENGLRLRSSDTGLARRLVCVPFLYPCPKSQIDKRLREKLWAERDAIVTKVILDALRDLHRRDYSFTFTVEGERLKRKYMRAVEPSVQSFVDDMCFLTPEEKEWTSELYKEYVRYCGEHDMEPVSRKQFAPMIYALPGVHQHKFQQNHIQLQGAEGICLKR